MKTTKCSGLICNSGVGLLEFSSEIDYSCVRLTSNGLVLSPLKQSPFHYLEMPGNFFYQTLLPTAIEYLRKLEFSYICTCTQYPQNICKSLISLSSIQFKVTSRNQ